MTSTTIPQTNPKANYLAHKAEIDAAIMNVLESGWYIFGQSVSQFEEAFANYINTDHAIGVANGTDALHLALRACGVGHGDKVITVSHTAVATVAAIELTGASPILVDIDPTTYTIDPSSLEEALSSVRAKAIVAVHLYGHPADMPAILELARRHGSYVIEDCAQSHGAMLEGQRVGSWGDIAAFSFYPTKNLGGLGDGGMVTTNNAHLAKQVRLLQQYGWEKRYISQIAGLNSRLDELQAAILQVKLRYLDEQNECRRQLAKMYQKQLATSNLLLPTSRAAAHHVYHQYVVRSREREALQQHLRQAGVGTLIHYPLPVHLQPAYKGRLPQVVALQETEQIAQEVLSLPMFPELTAGQVSQVTDIIQAFERRDNILGRSNT